jgi:hypothetical protein
MYDLTCRAIVARNTSLGNRANFKRRSTFVTHGSGGNSIQVVLSLTPKRDNTVHFRCAELIEAIFWVLWPRNFPRSVNPHRSVIGAMPQAVPVCRWEPSLRGERIGTRAGKRAAQFATREGARSLLHKILGVAHSVAQKAAKVAQNTPFLCSTAYRKLLICIRWEYYLVNFKTAASTM